VLETLREKEQVLAATMERLTVIQEEEQRLVAYDVHDSLAQVIMSAKQHLASPRSRALTVCGRMRAGSADPPAGP
jgi:signal transduction histidine kinase